jgi:deoxycytidine triphosphate deaminase
MLLTSKEILERGIVIPSQYSKPTQVGIDLSVCKVERILAGSVVYKDLTIIDPLNFMEVDTVKIDGKECWRLDKGSYAITFNEGCKIPDNATGFVLHRSSLYRTGTSIVSPVWDSGYETEKMGTVMIVSVFLILEKNARAAQMFFHQNAPVDELYDGQWQGGTNAWEQKK